MVKIKQKKQLNLPQLIEWAMDNDIKHRVFESNPNFDGVTYKLGFDIGGDLYFDEPLTPTLLFTVEVEEEIDEDTVFETLIEIYKNAENLMFSTVHRNVSINNVKTNEYLITSGFYILNDDLTMTLILRDGKLVE